VSPALAKKLVAALLTPHVLTALLAFGAAVVLFFSTRPPTIPPPPTVEIAGGDEGFVETDVRLLLVDVTGLEWQKAERVRSRPGESALLTAVLGALRTALVEEGVWPEELPAPRAFLETIERRRVAVVDVSPPAGLGVSVAQERAIHRALVGTAELAGAADVVFLRDGEPADTLLGHVAVPSAL
jgi:hypothetical protein